MTPKGLFSKKAFFYTVVNFCCSEAVEGVCTYFAYVLGDYSLLPELKQISVLNCHMLYSQSHSKGHCRMGSVARLWLCTHLIHNVSRYGMDFSR